MPQVPHSSLEPRINQRETGSKTVKKTQPNILVSPAAVYLQNMCFSNIYIKNSVTKLKYSHYVNRIVSDIYLLKKHSGTNNKNHDL